MAFTDLHEIGDMFAELSSRPYEVADALLARTDWYLERKNRAARETRRASYPRTLDSEVPAPTRACPERCCCDACLMHLRRSLAAMQAANGKARGPEHRREYKRNWMRSDRAAKYRDAERIRKATEESLAKGRARAAKAYEKRRSA